MFPLYNFTCILIYFSTYLMNTILNFYILVLCHGTEVECQKFKLI